MQSTTSVKESEPRHTTNNRIVICRSKGCFDIATVSGYCRLHYLSNWKKLKEKEAKKQGSGLGEYLKEMSSRFPEEYLERLKAEIEELSEGSKDGSDEKEERSNYMDGDNGDEDMDTIIKGIRVEDF